MVRLRVCRLLPPHIGNLDGELRSAFLRKPDLANSEWQVGLDGHGNCVSIDTPPLLSHVSTARRFWINRASVDGSVASTLPQPGDIESVVIARNEIHTHRYCLDVHVLQSRQR